MKILNITAQKPNGTGSGTVFTELVRVFAAQGHEQAAIAGITRSDAVSLPEGVRFYPVYFDTPELPFPVVGMSDEMPYVSTRYRDMTPEMAGQFQRAFLLAVKKAVAELDPDLILCHHLYLLTATVRLAFPDRVVYGVCHNTDLRQMEKTDLERELIRSGIRALDRVFVLKNTQIAAVRELFRVPAERICVMGAGYNRDIFHPAGQRPDDGKTRIVFVGKIAEKKGVFSLIRCLEHLHTPADRVEVDLAGAAGDAEEYARALRLAEKSRFCVRFLGRMSPDAVAGLLNRCDIFALPSYSEGIPLTLLEALACGERAVVSDLPGLREWTDEYIPGADIRYVTLPAMTHVDEPVESELAGFERRFARALDESIAARENPPADMSRVFWERVADRITGRTGA